MKTRKTICMIVCLILLFSTLTGCGGSPEPVDPMIHNVNTIMYCTTVSTDGAILEEYTARLVLSITDYEQDEDYINITLPLSQNFQYTTDHESVSFTIEHEDKNLPYYCMTAYLYHPKTDTLSSFDFAVDIEKQCMILKPTSNEEEFYVVASSNRFIPHYSITNYFEQFLDLYYHGE